MATKQIAWQTGSGNITLTYQGQGDGPISVVSDANNVGARSQTITIQTTKGGIVTKNVTVSQAACPIPVGTVLNYAYTGSYQEVELPAGQYKLQCWGAQGGSNAAASSYGITAKAGGKGGYSEGVLTLTSKTTVRIYVGGQGSSSAGGFNGGGSTSGSSTYNSGDTYGTSRMGGGGGATDIRLSDGALLSRMIVAGGGSGGAMGYQKVTTTVTSWESMGIIDFTQSSGTFNGYSWSLTRVNSGTTRYYQYRFGYGINPIPAGTVLKLVYSGIPNTTEQRIVWSDGVSVGYVIQDDTTATTIQYTHDDYSHYQGASCEYRIQEETHNNTDITGYVTIYKQVSSTSVTENRDGNEGYAGGGVRSIAYDTPCVAHQTAAGTNGSFGQGANQTTTNYRYCGGAGGGGWYGGGGGEKSDSTLNYTWRSGGGSGWVNTSASAGNRPSGFNGLQLDSGTTYKGVTSFPAPGGGNETGHAGNGYARITRLS